LVDPCQILGKSDADTKQTVSNSTFIFEKSFYFVVTAAGTERLSKGRGPTATQTVRVSGQKRETIILFPQ